MAQSAGYTGYGVLLGIGDGASAEAFVSIGEVLNVDGPGFTKDTHDVSHATSPNRYREFIAGFKDGGEVTLELNMLQADYANFLALFDSSGANNYQLTLPDSNYSTKPTIVFAAHVTTQGLANPVEDKSTMAITLKVTGKPVYTQGS